MKRYMVFAYEDTPKWAAVGLVEVPGCFRPTDQFVAVAATQGLLVDVVSEDELPGPPPSTLLLQGADILAHLRELRASQN